MRTPLFTRRDFVRLGSGAAAACAAGSRLRAKQTATPIGLQLFTVRDQLAKDFPAALAEVRSSGYTVVEAAGFYDRTAADFRRAMDLADLRCVSAHLTLSALQTELDRWLDYSHALGLDYIVCSSSDDIHRDPAAKGPKTLDDWRWTASEFNRVGERVKAAGMTFAAHNHTPEFASLDGVLVYDQLLHLTDPKLVFFELDCGWVYAAGHNPLDYLRKSPARFPLLHVKDMVEGANGNVHSTELGRGKIDYAPILRAATGLKYYFIEQEEFDIDPSQALRADVDYIRRLGV